LRAIGKSVHAPFLHAADIGHHTPQTQLLVPNLPTRLTDPTTQSSLPFRPDILLHNPAPVPSDHQITPANVHYTILEIGYGMDTDLDSVYTRKLAQHAALLAHLRPHSILYLPIVLGNTGALHSSVPSVLAQLRIPNPDKTCQKLIASALHRAQIIKRERLQRVADEQPP
jgi:hypothetical protein